jgi:xylulokinase
VTPPDLVVGVDSSTTATKAVAFDRGGRVVASARRPHPTSRPLPMHAEQDPEDWWSGLAASLREVAAEVGPGRIAALCVSHQRETFALLDDAGRAVRPGILWIDERSRSQVESLSRELGADRLRAITGKHPDPTPALYALAWLLEHEPEAVRRARRVADVHGFLVERLTGEPVTSTASADPLGLLDTGAGDWSDLLLGRVGLDRSRVQRLVRPGTVVARVTPVRAAETGLAEGTPVVAGGGDGQFAGLGLGVLRPGRAYLSLGSGAVCGLHSPAYAHSRDFRTLTSPSGEGFILETCIRTCTQLVDWVLALTGRPLASLEAEAAALPPGADGLLLVPYWSGVMSPHWDPAARGTVTGLGLDHGPAHLFRAALEGVAFEQALELEAMEAGSGRRAEELVATGGGAASDLWCAIVASVTGRPLRRSPVPEAVCLGAAVAAAAGIGWFGSIGEAADAMSPEGGEVVEPRPGWAAAYAEARAAYAGIFPSLAAAARLTPPPAGRAPGGARA